MGIIIGYKGYRYIRKPSNRINFNNFNELISIIEFDNKVKALLYPQVMFIETALKSYVLEIIIQESKTGNFSEIYSNLMTDYKSYSGDRYKNAYKRRLDKSIYDQIVLTNDYSKLEDFIKFLRKKV